MVYTYGIYRKEGNRMAKRLFSTSKRAEKILSHLRDQDANLSEYISNSVLDEALPVYSQLRIEALYLLDYVTDRAQDWTGAKLQLATGIDETQYYTIQTLERGVAWLKKHHIQNPNVLKDVVAFFATDIESPDSSKEAYSEFTESHIKQIHEKIRAADSDISDIPNTFGHLAGFILNQWDIFWDMDVSYDLILDVVLCEQPIENIDPFHAINLLQRMENQYILEAIQEIK